MILTQLRAATAEDHRRAEAAMPSLEELARPDGYAWSIRALHKFFEAWEAPLFATLAPLAGELSLSRRWKLPLLVSDLDALGLEATVLACDAPGARALAVPRALGALYVMEGSTLGGQVIERRCAERLGVSPDHGIAFYHGYGAQTGTQWKNFGAVMESHVTRHGDGADVIDGARRCFEALGTWLGQLAPLERGTIATVHGG